jgi:hypothetical protein
MANIFKTTLKKDVITDIVDNDKREVRFPLTKFWATRFADEFNLEEKTFVFKTFDSLEFSSPSNKDTDATTFVYSFIRTYVDGEEFVLEFKEPVDVEEIIENLEKEEQPVEVESNNAVVDIVTEDNIDDVMEEVLEDIFKQNHFSVVNEYEYNEYEYEDEDEIRHVDENIVLELTKEKAEAISDLTDEDKFELLTKWIEDDRVLESLYESESVFATNAKQVIVLPKGKVLGFKKSLPVNNDVEVRIEFDMSDRIYFDLVLDDFDTFIATVANTIEQIRKNNFVFIWKRHTGIFREENGRIYFGIKYSTRKSIGFNRKYNVQ